jgi:5'(3')-deoxyribonucleotidase
MITGLSSQNFVKISIVYSVYIYTLHMYQILLPFTSYYISLNHRFPLLVEQHVVNCCDKRVACSMTMQLVLFEQV